MIIGFLVIVIGIVQVVFFINLLIAVCIIAGGKFVQNSYKWKAYMVECNRKVAFKKED